MGKLLEVDLTSGAMRDLPLDEDMCRKFIGGTGIGARLLLDRLDPTLDALDPLNPLIIMTGPLTGSRIIGAVTRFSVTGRSPYTGLWGESSCGGSFGVMLKRSGYDGLIVIGESEKPVYLDILDGVCALKDASDLWGKDTYETTDLLKERIKEQAGKTATVLSIGPAGENLVGYANIMNGSHNAAGRCGFGALMGSKKLKAITAWGSKKTEFSDEAGLNALRDAIKEKQEGSIACISMHDFGTNGGMDLGSMSGDVPIKNWSKGEWDDGINQLNGPTMSDTILTRNTACFGCTVGCKRVVKVDEGPYAIAEGAGPEYETVGAFGTMMMIDDLKPVSKINELCNRYGLDTISCGGTISWLIECMEAGVITPEQTGGIKAAWGDPGPVIELLGLITRREGIGDILARGSRAAARALGAGREFLVEVKRLEVPQHDPRAFWGMGLNYAVGNRGACHVNTVGLLHEHGFCFYPQLGLDDESMPHTTEGKAFLTAQTQDLGMIFNCLCLCHFPGVVWDEDDFVNSMNLSTGFGFDLDTLMTAGRRVWYLKRGINNLLGATREDDYLPQRLLTAQEDGPTAGVAIDFQPMLDEWYELRRIDAQGRPEREVLEGLELPKLAAKIHG